MTTSSLSTPERILAAAETLFAEHGFDGTSLRQVTSAAGVNLAAVNYHFGSKDQLIHKILHRQLDELNAERSKSLEILQQKPGRHLEDVLSAFIRPPLAMTFKRSDGNIFVRVMVGAYLDRNADLRRFLSSQYGNVMERFIAEFARLLPHLDQKTLIWRLDLVIGALTYVMADFGVNKRRPGEDREQHMLEAERQLVAFGAAGLRTPGD